MSIPADQIEPTVLKIIVDYFDLPDAPSLNSTFGEDLLCSEWNLYDIICDVENKLGFRFEREHLNYSSIIKDNNTIGEFMTWIRDYLNE